MPRKDDYARDSVALVLAGGRGSRLHGLTEWRAKPALRFGAGPRIIDFSISNCFNSGVRQIGVLTQYHPFELIRHFQDGWGWLRGALGECIDVLPASERATSSEWYGGTADAVRQNLDWLTRHRPRWVLILSGDHVYKLDYRTLLAWHVRQQAGITVACVEVPLAQASAFGIVRTAGDRVVDLVEKPRRLEPTRARDGMVLASMGVYVFDHDVLRAELQDQRPGTRTDFACDILPRCIATRHVSAFSMAATRWRYWRDVGTIDSYWGAQMDLLGAQRALDLSDPEWPVWSAPVTSGPVRFDASGRGRPAVIESSIVAAGCTIGSAVVRRSVVGPDARVESAMVEDSVLLAGSSVGEGALVRRAVVDEGCRIPPGAVVDATRADGIAHGAYVTEGGVVLVTGPPTRHLRPGDAARMRRAHAAA